MICFAPARKERRQLRVVQNKLEEGLIDGVAGLRPDRDEIKIGILYRLGVLSKLEPGWLYDSDGSYGEVPSPDEWEWLSTHVAEYPSGLPKAFIFPTMNGELRFEWVFVTHIIEADIQPSKRKAIGRVVRADSLLEIPEKTIELSLAENWTPLFAFVKKEREQ